MTIESYLERIATALEVIAKAADYPRNSVAVPPQEQTDPKPAARAATKAPKAAAPAALAAPAAPAIAYKDVQEAGQKLFMKKGRDALTEVLGRFSAARGPDLKPEQYQAALEAIKAEIDKPEEVL
jgi:hypothetical protein